MRGKMCLVTEPWPLKLIFVFWMHTCVCRYEFDLCCFLLRCSVDFLYLWYSGSFGEYVSATGRVPSTREQGNRGVVFGGFDNQTGKLSDVLLPLTEHRLRLSNWIFNYVLFVLYFSILLKAFFRILLFMPTYKVMQLQQMWIWCIIRGSCLVLIMLGCSESRVDSVTQKRHLQYPTHGTLSPANFTVAHGLRTF